MKEYHGELELQIFNANTGSYEPIDLEDAEPSAVLARMLAGKRPWRICKCDRPLKPVFF